MDLSPFVSAPSLPRAQVGDTGWRACEFQNTNGCLVLPYVPFFPHRPIHRSPFVWILFESFASTSESHDCAFVSFLREPTTCRLDSNVKTSLGSSLRSHSCGIGSTSLRSKGEKSDTNEKRPTRFRATRKKRRASNSLLANRRTEEPDLWMTFVTPSTSLLRVWLFRPRSAIERGAQLGLVRHPKEMRHLLSSSTKETRTFSREEERDWSNLLLRSSLSRSCDGLVPPEAFVFDREPKGKPIVDWNPTLYQAGLPEHSALRNRIAFNLSHTDDMLACAVLYDASEREPGSELSVGIDVESCHRRTKRGAKRIAQRRLTVPESEWIMQEEEEHAMEERFLQVWTLKEAYLKATGDGLNSSLGLKGFSVQIGEETCNELIERVSEAIGSVHEKTKPLQILLEDRSPVAAGKETVYEGEREHIPMYTRSAAGCGWRGALFNIEDTHLLALCYNLGWRRGVSPFRASDSSIQSGCRLQFSSTVPLLGPDRALDEVSVLAAML